jgi:predicted ATPase
MGKTRLAIEAAWNQVDSFSDGVWFVPLAPLSSPEFMVPALASALDFSFFGNQEPKAQLLGYLKDKEMLLVLDNLEHLLEGTSLINEVLASAPSVKVLATSRERLNLHAEWVFDLAGMAVPAGVVTDPQDFDAVQLFLQAAQQARAEFTVDDASLQAVTRICQLVEGMPLALELAASWLRLLRVEEVAAKLEAGMDFLEAPTRDVPARHRSVRAVFDHSWNLLQPREQEALRKLSVFRGGFILRAAETVAGTSLPLLLALINKSFLRRSSTGRFTQHPPVRQFTQERAQAHPGEKAQGEERHSLFYAAFLQERARWMRGGAQQQASLLEMDEELDNIRSAWRWAIEQHDVNALEQSLDCLYHFYYNRGLLQEGEDAFGEAAKGLEESVTLAKLLARQGVFAWSLYHLDLSEEISRRSLATLSRFGAPPDTFALINLACAPAMRMDWELAEERNFDLLNASKAKGDLWGMACALSNLGNIAIGRGALEGAEASLRESIALFRQLDDRWGLAMAVGNLGHLHLKLGRLEKAEPCLREGLGFAREVGHPSLIAGILGSLGTISYRLHQLEQAKRSYLESLAIYKERGSYGPPIPTEPHVFWPLMGLAETTHALEEYRESLGLYREALRIALAFEAYADAADVVVGMADLLTSMGEKEKALSLLSFSLSHPHTTKDSKEKAIRLFAGLAAELPAHVVVFAREQGNALSFQSSEQLLADAQVHEQSG